MISLLKGIVAQQKDTCVIIDVNGVGYEVYVPALYHYTPQQTIQLSIHMYWNQEQGPTLYGFTNELEKTVFLLVISCSGIGPKIALSVLASLKPASFLKALQTGDEKMLSSISGIGSKKAEQMIVQLRSKAAKLLESCHLEGDQEFEHWKNLQEVLDSLNYSRTEITQAMNYIKDESSNGSATFDQLLRKALSFLSKRV